MSTFKFGDLVTTIYNHNSQTDQPFMWSTNRMAQANDNTTKRVVKMGQRGDLVLMLHDDKSVIWLPEDCCILAARPQPQTQPQPQPIQQPATQAQPNTQDPTAYIYAGAIKQQEDIIKLRNSIKDICGL